jgi:hypothetical protein
MGCTAKNTAVTVATLAERTSVQIRASTPTLTRTCKATLTTR